ncbi:energy transducer TonB [Marinobacterium litorale]|uniref:energy transducer TonB n=1 Tax=Marinobacterium litorale TaxID=404770 RepID=UPI0003F84DD8|nr:energy transducer TonB [Marinobacterium litorale]
MAVTRRHWFVALALAVALHLGLFSLVAAQSPTDGAEAAGEMGVEIDLGMMGDLGEAIETQEEQTQEEQAQEPVEQPVEEPVEEVVEPEPEPVPEPEPEPEPVQPKQKPVIETQAKQKPEPKPEPKPEKPEPVKPQPPERPLTRSDDRNIQQEQHKASTGRSSASTNGGSPGATRSYFTELAAHLARHKRYPVSSRRRGEEGITKITFEVDRDGRLLSYQIAQSSGSHRLDEAVIDMLESARPLPAFPPDMQQQTLKITVPVEFAIH